MMNQKSNFARLTSLAATLLITLVLASGCAATEDTGKESQTTQSEAVESQKETVATEQETEAVTEQETEVVTEKETEVVTEKETEVVTETEVRAEAEYSQVTEEVAEQEQQETEVEVEQSQVAEGTSEQEEVLFRVRVSNPEGAFVADKPSTYSFNEYFFVEYGTEYEVYEIYENEPETVMEGKPILYYRIKMEDGREEYIWSEDVIKCE